MKRIDLEQGSLEWFEYRFNHRNASEAATVMGKNPWQTKRQLFEEKRDRTISEGNVATNHGNNLETAARAKAEEALEVELTPVVFEDGVYSASLDGYGVQKFGKREDTWKVEIKCPYSGEKGDTWRAIQGETNRIQEHYRWQLVHQCYVCPTTHTVFFVYVDDDTWDMCHFTPTPEETLALLAAWDDFEANEPEPDYQTIEDTEVQAAIVTHKLLREQESAIKKNLKDVETFLKKAVTANSTHDNSYIQWVERKGNVDYSKVPQLEGVDLEQFRKEGTKYMKITHRESK